MSLPVDIEQGEYPGRRQSSQDTVGDFGLMRVIPLVTLISESFGHVGCLPPIHHQRGLDNGAKPLLSISTGSTPNASENVFLSESSIRVHSKENMTLSVFDLTYSRIFFASRYNPEC